MKIASSSRTSTEKYILSSLLVTLAALALAFPLTAQSAAGFQSSAGAAVKNTAVKTNLLYLAAATANVGIERTLSPKTSVELDGYLNLVTFSDNMKLKNWMLQPEYRYWFCNTLMGGFIGAHLLGGQYNIGGVDLPFSFLGTDYAKLKNSRYEGWMAGAGIAYGYAWPLSQHWNLEAEFGFGYVYTRYDSFQCEKCGEKLEENQNHHYVGPTKAALNLIYIF